MRGLLRNLGRKAVLARDYLDSALHGGPLRQDLEALQTFCLFLGYPRSGHSLVGSLMDAHPDMVFAHEANALKAVRYGFSRNQLCYWLLSKSRDFTAEGRTYTGYSYEVEGQWQGRYRDLKVIGDKYGNFTVEVLVRQPGLLDKARRRVGVPVRFVHVTRNPYDNIATIFTREKYELPGAVDYYFDLVRDVLTFTECLPAEDLLVVRHEELISSPRDVIAAWCDFVGVAPEPDYVEACAGIIYDSPHRSRQDIEWPEAVLADIRDRAAQTPFLQDYTFDR